MRTAAAVVDAGVDECLARLSAVETDLASLRARLATVEEAQPENRFSLCLVSGEFEKVTAGLMLANMAAAMEMQVTLFFAFWGVQAVKRGRRYRGKPSMEKVLTAMLTRDIGGLSSGKFNFGGLGPAMFTKLMQDKGVATPSELLRSALDAGVELLACTTSMEVFAIAPDELLPGVGCCGAAQFLDAANRSKTTLIL